MNVNPAGVVLLAVGVIAVLVGVRGSQAQVFAALTGKSSTAKTVSLTPAAKTVAGVAPKPMGQHPAKPSWA